MTTRALERPVPPTRIPERPREHEGAARDDVRLMVTTRADDVVAPFRELPTFLRAGDLVVVNDSETLPASLPVSAGHERLHLSTPMPDGDWTVEIRAATRYGSEPAIADHGGRVIALPAGGRAEIVAAHPRPRPDGTARLWRARLDVPTDLLTYLHEHGRPIRYGDPDVEVPLGAYQTLFARRPGSAEMPSAARPFTPAIVAALRRRGIGLTPITLHTGVSSQEAGEPPYAEPFHVPTTAAVRVARTRARGGRVIAVGTTVARALESAAAPGGLVVPRRGWTDHVIGAAAPPRVVDGLVTGWHDAGASHLDLVAAVIGDDVLRRAYDRAHGTGLRWHEFGDSHLLLP